MAGFNVNCTGKKLATFITRLHVIVTYITLTMSECIINLFKSYKGPSKGICIINNHNSVFVIIQL